EFGTSAANDEHAFGLFPCLAWLEFGRRCSVIGRAPPPPIRLWFANDIAFGVVHQLSYGDGWDRNTDDVLPSRGRDVGCAGEARSHLRNLFVESDHHFEVGGLSPGRGGALLRFC